MQVLSVLWEQELRRVLNRSLLSMLAKPQSFKKNLKELIDLVRNKMSLVYVSFLAGKQEISFLEITHLYLFSYLFSDGLRETKPIKLEQGLLGASASAPR